jgi:SAM-dependent methyltransferase
LAIGIARQLYLGTPLPIRRQVGRLVPPGVKRAVRSRVGPTPWSEAEGPLEANPSWNSLPVDYWVGLGDGEAYNHRSQTIVVEYLAQAARPPEGAKLTLLDVACGNGRLYRELLGTGLLDRLDYRGSDLTPNLVEAARRLDPGVPFDEGSMEELPYADGSFDVVVCQHAIQYLEYYDKAMAELLRVSRWLTILVVKEVSEGVDRLGTYFNQRHQTHFRLNLYEPGKLKAFAREHGAALAFTLNDARFDDPDGQHSYVFYKTTT